MLKRLKRILVGVVVGVAVLTFATWILIQTLGYHEDRYQGRSLSYWIKQAETPEAAISNQARVVLESQVIPQLTAKMFSDTNDSSLRLSLIEKLNALPGVQILFIQADGRRAGVVTDLGDMGSRAKAAIPDLIKALKGNDSAVRGPAAKALGQIHCEPEKIIPLLVDCLNSPLEGLPEGAARGLGEFGPLAQAAAPKLVELLKVPDKEMRAAAHSALMKIQPEAATQAGAKQGETNGSTNHIAPGKPVAEPAR
jgi:HEAT repeat protein